jgi:hypothetical protein
VAASGQHGEKLMEWRTHIVKRHASFQNTFGGKLQTARGSVRVNSERMIIVSLLLVGSMMPVAGKEPPRQPSFASVSGVGLELSGIGTVPGGVLIADDELVGSVLFVDSEALGGATETLTATLVKIDRARKRSEPHTELPRLFAVQDFEGIATDGASVVYLVGSHAPVEKDGWRRRPDREFLIKANWRPGDQELRVGKPKKRGVPGIYSKLIDHLTGTEGRTVVSGFNVEGLALRDGSLYIGLRSPLSEGSHGKALVFSAMQKDLFGKNSLRFNGPFTRLELNLGGGGVRGLHWDAPTAKLLVLSGPSTDGADVPSALWSYDFSALTLTLEHEFNSERIAAHGNPEGVTRFDRNRLLIAFDSEAKGRASLMFIPWR